MLSSLGPAMQGNARKFKETLNSTLIRHCARGLSGWHYGGNLVFENHLVMVVFQKNRVLIKRLNGAFEANTADQEYVHWNLFFLATGQKRILQRSVVGFAVFHCEIFVVVFG
jgi:hypothetical protein